jgi:SAM-dependent methyltransferase
VGGEIFGSLRRVTPLSRAFGFDRGQPIDRYYIDKFLSNHVQDIRGRVLEIGEATYAKRFGGMRLDSIDVLHVREGNPEATIIADLTAAHHIPTASFDCILLLQTLHLIFDIPSAIQTLHRILKPGGVLLATFPGISHNSCDEWREQWYWGLTTRSARRLFSEIFKPEDLTVESHGNVLATTAFLYGFAVSELTCAELDYRDDHYELLIALRASKPLEDA